EGFFQEVEEFTKDTADGLVVREQARREVEGALREFGHMRSAADRIKQPMTEFTQNFADDDEFHGKVKKALATPIVQLHIASALGPATSLADFVAVFVVDPMAQRDYGDSERRFVSPTTLNDLMP
ncbi:MAG: hypothetical protein CMJ78_19240, partial [Planctomycetaceae bacterium]|nr:hypothetical protein [Planctomycetaceae bacterium]